MFTGIVAALGTLVAVDDQDGARRLRIDTAGLGAGIEIGGSIAVNGVCLTTVARSGSVVDVEVMFETQHRSNLGALDTGDRVNLERPVGHDDLFEGHIVQGHVDGVATITTVAAEGSSRRLGLEAAPGLGRYIVEKGSIALDGVSLTVTRADGDGFDVALIPHTIAVTTLGAKGVGDSVNVELDVIAKYVERLVT